MDKVKGVQKNDQSWEREHLESKHRNTSSSKPLSKAAFMAALAQGVIPQAYGEELRESLSQIGNYAFLQAVQKRESRSRALDFYVNKEIVNPFDQNPVHKDLTKDAEELLLQDNDQQDNDQKVINEEKESLGAEGFEESNGIDVMPSYTEFGGEEPFSNWLIDDQAGLYSLAPIPFDHITEAAIDGVTMGDINGIEGTGDYGE